MIHNHNTRVAVEFVVCWLSIIAALLGGWIAVKRTERETAWDRIVEDVLALGVDDIDREYEQLCREGA